MLHRAEFSSIVLLLSICLLTLGCERDAASADRPTTPPFSATPVQFSGRVIENARHYEVDGPGYLLVEPQLESPLLPSPVRVIYFYGEFPPCPNTAVFDVASALEAGSVVEVYGLRTAEGEVTLCEEASYFVRVSE